MASFAEMEKSRKLTIPGLYMWSYPRCPRGYRGYHLTGTKDACRTLLNQNVFWEESCESSLTILLKAGSANAKTVVGISDPDLDIRSSELFFRPEMSKYHWTTAKTENNVQFQMGKEQRSILRDGIIAIAEGKGDWSIGEGENALWFWWLLPTVKK